MDRFPHTANVFLACLLAGLALSVSALTAFAQSVRVETILLKNEQVSEAPDVIVISAKVPDGERRLLRKNDAFIAGFEIIAPAMTVLVFKSDNGNRIVLEPGARIRIADVTKAGERYLLRRGSVVFEVLRALSFFNVEFDEQFVALVRGTKFRVTGEEGSRFTCEVLQGEVVVQRPERLKLANAEQPVVSISQVLLSATGKNKVEWSEAENAEARSFSSLDEADRFLRDKAAQSNLDEFDRLLIQADLVAASGDAKGALEIYYRLEQSASALREPDPRVAELYARKGDLLVSMDQRPQALRDYERARKTYNLLYTRDANREVARLLGREADVLTTQKRYDEAAAKYQQAIKVERQFTLGKETPGIRRNVEALNNLQRLQPNRRFRRLEPPALDGER